MPETQYDSIANSYDDWGDNVAVERSISTFNIHKLVQPVIKGARVLDLACGTGFLTRQLTDWGAADVVGVDISSGMIQVAKKKQPLLQAASHARFQVGDASIPIKYFEESEGPFDVVTGRWLLNYAADLDQMVHMFQTIALNLKDGGLFVGVVFKPHPHPESLFANADQSYAFDQSCLLKLIKRVDDGVLIKCIEVGVKGQEGSYETYYHNMDMFARAAATAGMNGRFHWHEAQLPPGILFEYGSDEANQCITRCRNICQGFLSVTK